MKKDCLCQLLRMMKLLRNLLQDASWLFGNLWGYPRLEQPGQLKVTAASGVHLHSVTHRPSLSPQLQKAVKYREAFTVEVVTVQPLSLSSLFPFHLFHTGGVPRALFNKRLANSSSSQSCFIGGQIAVASARSVLRVADANAGFQGWLAAAWRKMKPTTGKSTTSSSSCSCSSRCDRLCSSRITGALCMAPDLKFGIFHSC